MSANKLKMCDEVGATLGLRRQVICCSDVHVNLIRDLSLQLAHGQAFLSQT